MLENEQRNIIKQLISDITKFEDFIELLNQQNHTKSLELTQQIVNNIEYQTTLSESKQQKVHKILEELSRHRLSQKMKKFICTATEFMTAFTLIPTILHSLLISKILSYTFINDNSKFKLITSSMNFLLHPLENNP